MVVRIRSSRHPHEVAWLLAALLGGLSGSIAFETVASMSVRALPPLIGHGLYLLLALGSLVALAGVYAPGETGALVERAGLYALSGLSAGYAVMIMAYNGPRGLALAAYLATFAVSSVFRVVQIHREIKELRAAIVLLSSEGGA